jgi:hypothetical protein
VRAGGRGYTGSLYRLAPVREIRTQDNQWFTLHVTAIGNNIRIRIDDSNVVEYSDPQATYMNGYVALQHYSSRTRVQFKNVMVKPLRGR